jgi:ABC-type multidrug transport system ATPase subunit
VGETLEFAFQCKAGGSILRDERTGISQEQLDVIQKAEQEGLTRKIMLNILGLTHVEETFVGDATVRGISGGQRRRVTVGEMLMSRTPVVCGDEISTGLDAASTYDMVDVLFNLDRSNNFSRVFALLQPSPETVSLFDEVIVLAEGRIIYAGPIEDVEDYFAEIGFKSPEFVDIADFLQMVSTDDRQELYDPPAATNTSNSNSTAPAPDTSAAPDAAPAATNTNTNTNTVNRRCITGATATAPTVADLATTFKESYHGKRIQDVLLETKSQYGWEKVEKRSVLGKVDKFLRKSSHGDLTNTSSAPARTLAMSKFEAVKHKYANPWYRSTMLITRRFLTLWVRDRAVLAFSVVRNIINGASVGGVFINAEDFISIQGALFQTGIFVLLGSLQTSAGLVSDRVLFYKHADANFYSAWPYVCGRTLSQIPQTLLLDTVVSGTVFYFMIGLADRESASNFFTFLLILFLFSLVMNQQLAVFASFASEARLQVYSACTLFVAILFSGFILPPSTIPNYCVWFYWWNPFAWAYRAFVLNEVYSGRWSDPEALLTASGFIMHDGSLYDEKWIWWGVLYMFVYFLICCIFTALGLTYSRNTGDHVAPQETHQHKGTLENEMETRRRIEIPFKPLTLSFQDLCYEVSASTSKEKLLLLKNVNGIFRPGTMCALMGSSGAGCVSMAGHLIFSFWIFGC